MNTVMAELSRWEQRKLRVWIRRETDAATRNRMLMLLQVSKGKSVANVAQALHVARSTVYRLLKRFFERGWSVLADRREENGPTGVDEMFMLQLRAAVAGSPQGGAGRQYTLFMDAGVVVRSHDGTDGHARVAGHDESVARQDRRAAWPTAPGVAVPVEKRAENKAFAEDRPVDQRFAQERSGRACG